MAAWPCLVCFCGLWSPTTQLAFSFFSYTTTPTYHSLSFVLSCLFPCPCPFPVCVCVGDGGWAQCFRLFSEFVSVVPPVAITPPPPTPAGLGPASFLPVPRTHPSVLSSSSSSSCSCCCKVDGKASEGFTNHTPPLCFVACPSLFCCVCVVCCVVAWWAWLVVVLVATPRLFRCHQCLCFQSFTTHPPRFTTQSQSLSSSCPCAHSFCHSLTHSQATPPRHTHTRGSWCTLVPGVCVCAHGVGCGRAWLATHTSTHSLCPTPHHSSSCCWWWWWMWWWQRGCCGVCGHLVHSLAVLVLSTPDSHTHTRGDGHVVVVAVCVVWLPPPLCAFPTNHHHCVRCPALSAVCV